MVSDFTAPSRAEIERAKRRLGLTSTNPSQVGFRSEPAQQAPAEEDGGSLFGNIADGFRAVVPQGVRDAVGAGFDLIDTPLSERFGFRIPDDPLFFDEVGNFLLDEATRPSNLLIAAGGAGLAGKAATSGSRLARIGAGFVAPAGGTNFGTRLAAETAVAAGARGGAEVADRVLPESTPTPVRVALGLAAGVVGGGAALRATRAAVRGTLTKDLLALPVQPIRAGQLEAELPRKGTLIKARTVDHLGTDYDIESVIPGRFSKGTTVAEELRMQVDAQTNRLTTIADEALSDLGKVTRHSDGNYVVAGIQRADGLTRPAYVQEVLEFPDRFVLTPEQRGAVDDLSTIQRSVFEEGQAFNVPLQEAGLETGQNFIHRKVLETAKGDVRPKGGGTSRLAVAAQKSRSYTDPAEAIADGIVYDHPLTAIKEYVQKGLSNAANEHLRTLVVPFSDTSSLRVPPVLRAKHDGLVNRLRGLTATHQRLDQRTRAAIDAFINAAEPDLDALSDELQNITVGLSATGAQGRNFGMNITEVANEIASVKADLDSIRPEWRQSLDASRAIPPGRGIVSASVAPALVGRDFPAEVASRIERYYSKGVVANNQLGDAVKAVGAVNRAIIPIRAVGDASATLNQLGAVAFSHPLLFGKNFALAFKDAWTESSFRRFIRANAEDGAAHGLAVMGKGTNFSDFEFQSFFDRFPGTAQAQRHFRAFTTRMRVDIYNSLVDAQTKAGRAVSDLDKSRIARSLNRITGVANGRAGDLETAALFAPNFLRSSIETIEAAALDGSLEGSLARQYLRNMVVAGQSLALVAASGVIPGTEKRDPAEVLSPFDLNALKRGEIRLNSNFGTVRAFGQDISLYGRFDSIARLAVAGADATTRAVSEQDALELFDALGYLLRSKGSPVLTTGINAAMGNTFTGEPFPSGTAAADALLPFTVSAFIQDWRETGSLGEAAAGGALNFFGAKSRPLSTFERLDNLSRGLYGKPWEELTGQQRDQIEAMRPRLVQLRNEEQERRAAGGDEKAQARVAFEEVTQRRLTNEAELMQQLQAGVISEQQFADAIEGLQKTASDERDQTLRVLGVDFGDPSSGPARALEAFYQTYDDAEVAPGVVDWDLRDALELELFRRIEAGEFGDPADARAAVVDRSRSQHDPSVDWYFQAKDAVAEAGYYDVQDQVFGRFVQPVARILGRVPTGYGDMVAALNIAERDGDIRTATALKQVQNLIERQVAVLRLRIRLQNPEVDSALLALGRVSTPARQRLSLR